MTTQAEAPSLQAGTGEPDPTALPMQAMQANGSVKADPTKFSGKKSKATAKKGGAKSQYATMLLNDIPKEEVADFRHALLGTPHLGMFMQTDGAQQKDLGDLSVAVSYAGKIEAGMKRVQVKGNCQHGIAWLAQDSCLTVTSPHISYQVVMLACSLSKATSTDHS